MGQNINTYKLCFAEFLYLTEMNTNDRNKTKRGKIERSKLVIWVSLAVFIMLSLLMFIYMISSGNTALRVKGAQQMEELKGLMAQVQHGNTSQLTEADFVGIYDFTDIQGCVWELSLKADGTATIHSLNKEGEVSHECQGEWDFNPQRGYPNIWFHENESLYVWFPSGSRRIHWLCIEDNYIYLTKHALESQNPEMRLAVKKSK